MQHLEIAEGHWHRGQISAGSINNINPVNLKPMSLLPITIQSTSTVVILHVGQLSGFLRIVHWDRYNASAALITNCASTARAASGR